MDGHDAPELEAFLSRLYREFYEAHTGQKDRLAIAPIYAAYAALFTEDAVRRWIERADTDRLARPVAEFVARQHLDARVAPLTDALTNAVAIATVAWDGRDLPYFAAQARVASEADPARRHDLAARVAVQTGRADPARIARLTAFGDDARALGFASYRDLWERLAGLHLSDLATEARRLLTATAPHFHDQAAALLAEAGIPMAEAIPADLSFIWRTALADPAFSPDRLLSTVGRTLDGLGFDLARQPNILIDTADRPGKRPRPACYTIRIPDDLRVALRPRGGGDDYGALLHELGHAEHMAHSDRQLPVAHRYLGDASVSEAYAMVLEGLVRQRTWLTDVLEMASPDRYLRIARFRELATARRYAAKLLFELELFAGDPATLAPRYVALVGDALGVRVQPEQALADVDDHFYDARYVRAWLLAAMLRRALVTRFGDGWHHDRQAGAWLADLWRHGQALPAEAIAAQLGAVSLTADALIAEALAD